MPICVCKTWVRPSCWIGRQQRDTTVTDTPYTLGIEEEYLLVDLETGALAEAPAELMEACAAKLESSGQPGIPAMPDRDRHARLQGYRGGARGPQAPALHRLGLRHGVRPDADRGLLPPLADWKNQHHTDKDRYNQLAKDLGGVVRRMLICGMHMHVGLPDPDLRVDLMGQLSYFLPHLLALSSSSPFWQGEDTGLASYRLTVFDNLPRTGLPPRFSSWAEYERTTGALIEAGPDRGHDQDLVGPAPLAPLPDAGDAHLRRLPEAGGCAVASPRWCSA
jgi:carboxylate-amine ligase